jgi:hypothetical protein
MDINRIKKKLIHLFALHTVAEIEQDRSKLLRSVVGTVQYRKLLHTGNSSTVLKI